jgi:hypothetical protein
MKKIKALGAAAAVAVASISLAACGGGGSSAAGTYHLTEITEAGTTMTIDELNELASQFGMDEFDIVLELVDDGSFTLSDPSGLTGMEDVQGTWTEDGGTLTLTAEDSDVTGTLDGGTITLSDDSGMSMSFAK